MPWEAWLKANWFEIIQTVSITTGLVFGAVTIRQNTRTRRLSNLLSNTSNHRELWLYYLSDERLKKISLQERNVSENPISEEEHQYVVLLLLHLRASYEAVNDGMAIHKPGLVRDVSAFLKLPVPLAVWQLVQRSFEPEFVRFVEECRVDYDYRP